MFNSLVILLPLGLEEGKLRTAIDYTLSNQGALSKLSFK
jgi:hypothetical protein